MPILSVGLARARRARALGAVCAGLILVGLLPVSALGGLPCSFDSDSGQLSYSLAPAQDEGEGVLFVRDPLDDSIKAFSSLDRGEGGGCLGNPTVHNVDKIVVSPGLTDPDDYFNIGIDLSGGPFAPGKTNEPGGSDEIEFEIDLPEFEFNNHFRVVGGTAADQVTFGMNGVNLNSGEAEGVDADVHFNDVAFIEQHVVVGGSGADITKTTGGKGTGGPWPQLMTYYMGEGDDRYLAGEDFHFVYGGPGEDNISFAKLSQSNGGFGVSVDLSYPDFQGQIGIFQKLENIVGSRFHDDLSGNARPNRISAGRGSDIAEGRGGDDRLDGGRGSTDDCVGGPGQDEFLRCEAITN